MNLCRVERHVHPGPEHRHRQDLPDPLVLVHPRRYLRVYTHLLPRRPDRQRAGNTN